MRFIYAVLFMESKMSVVTTIKESIAAASRTIPEEPLAKRARLLTSRIIETVFIEVILQERTPDTWYIYDIDNVLGKNKSHFGSHQWFEWRCRLAQSRGESFERALDDWTAWQFKTDLEPVEAKTTEVVNRLIREGFPSIALTSRGMRLGERTIRQLRTINIDFSNNGIYNDDFFLPREMHREHTMFENGIIFTSGKNKGECLELFLAKVGQKPKRIVYIDDQLKHLEHVKNSCEKLAIEFFGYHYRRLDPWVETFDPEEAHEQLASLDNRLMTIQDDC